MNIFKQIYIRLNPAQTDILIDVKKLKNGYTVFDSHKVEKPVYYQTIEEVRNSIYDLIDAHISE